MDKNERTAKQRYKQKIQELRVELYPTDADIKDRIAERMAEGEAKATYIKRLIREDIDRSARRRSILDKPFRVPKKDDLKS